MQKFLLLSLILLLYPILILGADKIEINTASLGQLETLSGFGPVKAQAIIDARPFSSVDDLLRVKGIGTATLQKIKDQGLAYISVQSQQSMEITPVPDSTPADAEPMQNPALNKDYPTGVFINEVLPNPAGADETDEWIELYNSNSFDVDLSGWQLQDTIGTTATYTIPTGTNISANNFLVFKRPETKIMLNNDQDAINLLTPDGKIAGSAPFISAPLGQSYNKTGSGWQWSTTLTPGTVNVIPAASTKALPKTQKSDNNSNIAEAGLLDATENISINQDIESSNPWFLFFIVLSMTIILAGAVLFIKLKFSKTNVRT